MKDKKEFSMITPLPDYPEKKEWKICISAPFLRCERIYPMQQRKVSFIIENLKEDKNIEKIIIFGSSVSGRCHADSDVDIYASLKENHKIHMPLCDFAFDLWTNFTVDEKMYHEIQQKGVIVYER